MTFLSEVADHLLKNHSTRLGECTVVFPNRRAGLFLKKHLSSKIDHPVWSPKVLSLEDFLFQFSDIKKTDTLYLIFELYESFRTHQPAKEGFESFYFWGEMLLRDFEEVDHYLVNPDQLFKYVKDDRQLAEDFYFLNEKQEQIIRKFWQEFFPTASKSQQQFVETWRILAPVYQDFKKRLIQKGIGYTSHIYRSLLSELGSQPLPMTGPILFAGFNALTPAEERLIKYFILNHRAEILWDTDRYYLDDKDQEAGQFLRNYQKDTLLGSTFPSEIPQRIQKEKKISVTGVALEVGQAKLVGQQIRKIIMSGEAEQEEIVIVLPQDYMLFPVLNALPEEVTKLNVTMGYPLKETPLFGLLEAALEVQEHAQLTPELWLSFYHKPVLDILSHPYLYENEKQSLDQLIEFIQKNNQVRVLQQDLQSVNSTLLNAIFRDLKGESLASYLMNVVQLLGQQVVERFGLEREFLYHFQMMLHRLEEILSKQEIEVDLKTFKSLFRKAARSIRIPFTGEPVEGLQVMGVLETRNLDFKYVFMLNMNEDIFPGPQRSGSFIPYHIRRGFDLPTFEIQDAIYAYLFYRLFQRSQELSFYYNMYADFGLSGELSRFIRQIELESNLPIEHFKLSNSIHIREHRAITIEKTADILRRLQYYTVNGRGKLSPSALNTYLDCRLRFYFRYVLRLFTGDELSDELSPRDFGNVLHQVMELLYDDVTAVKQRKIIEENDFFLLQNSVSGAIEKAFRHHFKLKSKQRFELKGRNVVMAEVMTRFVNKTLEMDKSYAPFEILSLENNKEGNYDMTMSIYPGDQEYQIVLKGVIDRVDRKNGKVRVIDYKSGRDATEIESIEKLFDTTPVSDFKRARNKAGFQTLYYAMLYANKNGLQDAIVPGILNIQELFTLDFDERLKMKGVVIEDARPLLPEYQARFKELLSEIFDPSQPFLQTEDVKKCNFCDFRGMCGR